MLWQEIFMNLFTRQSGTLFSKTHPTTIVCQRPAKAPSSARLTSYWCLSCSWWWYGDDDNSNGDEKMIRIIILRAGRWQRMRPRPLRPCPPLPPSSPWGTGMTRQRWAFPIIINHSPMLIIGGPMVVLRHPINHLSRIQHGRSQVWNLGKRWRDSWSGSRMITPITD